MYLNRTQLLALSEGEQPLISGILDAATQFQTNGVDVTIENIWRVAGKARIGFKTKTLPLTTHIVPDLLGEWDLPPGNYLVQIAETLQLPLNVLAFTWPRSTLVRNGYGVVSGIIDAGYHGKPSFQIVVFNQYGVTFETRARFAQLAFAYVTPLAAGQGYSGSYQGEGLAQQRGPLPLSSDNDITNK